MSSQVVTPLSTIEHMASAKNSPLKGKSFLEDVVLYASQIKKFDREDWMVFIAWIGLMSGLVFSVFGFLLVGYMNGVQYPRYVWNVPLGTAIFVVAITFDTIGHRSTYKKVLAKGEALVHHITIFAGISAVVLLCAAYQERDFFMIPAVCMLVLSVMYSFIDELLHWHRYMTLNSDRVEMWAHFGIFVGHSIQMFAWWYWFNQGYPGVKETLVFFGI